MEKAYFITAMGTPLKEDETLHEEGLAIHLNDLWNHDMNGILVAGSMGAMQLLRDETYKKLIKMSVEISSGKGEIMIGAGDAGLARTKDRIEYISQFKVDGIAVLPPYFWTFNQQELIGYFKALADFSKVPIFLYDIPGITRTKLSMDTIHELAKHPNIKGIKLSCDIDFTREFFESMNGSFRTIVAQPNMVDVLLQYGIKEHLDGMWGAAPKWTLEIGRCVAEGKMDEARIYQKGISDLRGYIWKYGFAAFNVIMNARGIPGNFTPEPFTQIDEEKTQIMLDSDLIKKLVKEDPALA